MGKRRAKGEGSIYRRTDGRWVAQLYLASGKKLVKYGKTQREVREWLQEQKEAAAKGIIIESKDMTLAVFFKQYMTSAENNLRLKTLDSYQYLLEKHTLPSLGHIKLTQLRPDQVQSFYNEKMASGLSKRTVQYMHAVLHKGLEQATKWGLVNRNVSSFVDAPSPTKHQAKIWSFEQARKFLDQVILPAFIPCTHLATVPCAKGKF